MSRGLFITIEGGEGAGKSTQMSRIAERLRAAGRPVLTTREPGGTPGAEAIRALMVEGAANRWDAGTEMLLANAARRDHVNKVISPALEDGTYVLCDRFVHSTLAYQAGRDGVTTQDVRALHDLAIGSMWPDLTIVFDLDPAMAAKRAMARDGDDQGRFEKMGIAFHKQLRERFLEIAKHDARCRVIDASQSPDAVSDAIWAVLEDAHG